MIAVVDDDVCFAEETQELLYLSGFSSVVVVTHPHDSSLALLDRAELLILDLGLAATTALGVLDEVRQRGGDPAVVIVSGSGPEALGHVRSTATARGFRVLGALPKPVSPADLLDLLGAFNRNRGPEPGGTADAAAVLAEDARRAARGALTLRHTGTLDYAGTYLCGSAAEPLGTDLIAGMLSWQQELALDGRNGMVIAPLPDEVFLSRIQREAICHDWSCERGLRCNITFELGPEVHADPLQHAARMVELRLAGFNLLMRMPAVQPPASAELIELPISHFAIDAREDWLVDRTPGETERLRQTIHLLDRRDIAPICLLTPCSMELAAASTLGFSLFAAASSSPEGRGAAKP